MLQLSLEKTLRYKVSLEAKKLVSVLASSTLVTGTKKKTVETIKAIETTKAVETAGADKDDKKSKSKYPKNLVRVLCIQYPITFRKKSVPVLALFDLGSKINVIHPTLARKLGLSI